MLQRVYNSVVQQHERLTGEKNGASDGLKQELLVRKEDLVVWKLGDDQSRYGGPKGGETAFKKQTESVKAGSSVKDGKAFTARFNRCHKCHDFYDVTVNEHGSCKYHPGKKSLL